MRALCLGLFVAALPELVVAHGALVSPPSRNAVDRFLPAFRDGQSPQTPCTCPIGFRNASGDHGSKQCDQGLRAGAGGQPCLWWSQGCSIGCPACTGSLDGARSGKRLCNGTLEPTLPQKYWTMDVARDPGSSTAPDPYKYNPWRAPGHAPVDDACGRAGGTTPSHGHAGDAVFTTVRNPAFNVTFGDLGTRALPYAPSGTKWIAGEAVEVGWAIRYNHGGGYQYRLCKKDAPGGLTEACFQQLPLPFDRTKQALLWNNGTRLPLRGMFVHEGTSPAGSTWARNPVPRVNAPSERDAGCLAVNATADVGCVSFAPPCPQDCSGQPRCATPATHTDEGSQQGQCSGDWTGGQIVDTVIVPASTAPGEYVLGWRWDCEETTQVWSNCADVTICAPGGPCNVPPPFVPPLESSWNPPQYNASVVAAFRAKVLAAPTHFADDNPYKNGTVPAPGRQNDTSVCAVKYSDESARTGYSLQTFPSAELAAAAGAHVTHLHPCGACSSLQDLSAYMAATNLTAPVRSCGLKVLSKANEIACLKALGFTDDCTNIWYYNTLSSRAHCALQCLNPKYSKYPYNVPPSSADAPGPLNPCIQCDEDKSGPIFKQFSGRTRRDSGLLSAIDRPPSSIYEVVHDYY